ncbi:MAG TPA: YciI-like protein [Acidobacteriota bacterium]|nr:YciI-like protein [Acidobacteriota bacterium]
MPYYLLIYHVVEDYVSRRAPFRDVHLRLAQEARDRGELVLGGALADPVDKAVLVFRCEGPGIIEAFIQRDPYVQNGLVEKWEIRPWAVAIS